MVMNMDAPDTTPTRDRWIDDRLRALDPPDTWEPATGVALARFRQRAAVAAAEPRRGFGLRGRAWAWSAAASLACLIVLLTPATRAAAQRLWDVFFAERVEFVRLDVDKLPRSLTEQNIRMNGANKEVTSVEEAAGYVGFTPRLPDASLTPHADGDPRFQVTGAISLESRVNVLELEAAARHARLFDVHFPRAWDGARIAVHSSPIVMADYMSFQLMQVMPLAITTPPDFDLGAFTERILRIGGLDASAARTFSTQMAAAPFALVAISPDEEVTMRQVRLRAGEGTIVHDLNEDGSLQRTTLVWSTPDRLYAISSNLSDDEVIAIANAIPRE
jgi:hypothetical protein